MTPVVSVIMAMRNAKGTVRTAIESLQQQTLSNWELLVIDDASDDGSAAIIALLARDDSRILLIRLEERRRPAGARNVGLDRAQGEFIHFLDADDVITPK